MSLLDEVTRIESEALERIGQTDSLESVKELQFRYLGRKGQLAAVLRQLGALSEAERKQLGAVANQARARLEAQFETAAARFQSGQVRSSFDPTLPGTVPHVGTIHVVNQVMREMCEAFERMGFQIAHGPHVETDYFNFESLNFPPDHPARDMQDTFFVEGGRLLRTHTTPVQTRELNLRKPPMKIISPGRTFRNEAVSTRAHVSFHQVDGFLVDEHVTMADLKGVIVAFCRAFFGENLLLRFRPSFFPFTEPSAEVDISCFLCGGKGCQLCKYQGWLEILGCGMIHPAVLEMAGHDSEKYTGYAFGIGVERVAMLKYKINDIRLFFNNNVQFLRQFF
jgi:phenylalanyl-tRNA synthetase alpha chain